MNNRGYSCPVEATIDIIGGKWKSVILYHLIDDKKRFNELRRLIPAVTQRMLTLQVLPNSVKLYSTFGGTCL